MHRSREPDAALAASAGSITPEWSAGHALTDVVDHLRRAAARYPLLTAADEIELGRRIRAWQDWPEGPDLAPVAVQRRGRRALERFTVCNMRLAHKVAARFKGRGVPMEDLVQAATMGLHQAYLRFKPQYGYRSSSYAIWFAQQACQVAVGRMANTIVLPATVSEQIRRIHRATIRLTGEINRPPTEAEIAAAAGLSVKDLRSVQRAAAIASTRSLDAPLKSQDGTTSLMSTVASNEDPELELLRSEMTRAVRRLLACCPGLTPQQRYLLRCRFLITPAPSIPKLASQLHVSRQLLRELEHDALQILSARAPESIAAFLQTP